MHCFNEIRNNIKNAKIKVILQKTGCCNFTVFTTYSCTEVNINIAVVRCRHSKLLQVLKSFGELSQLLQCKTCTFRPALSCNFKKLNQNYIFATSFLSLSLNATQNSLQIAQKSTKTPNQYKIMSLQKKPNAGLSKKNFDRHYFCSISFHDRLTCFTLIMDYKKKSSRLTFIDILSKIELDNLCIVNVNKLDNFCIFLPFFFSTIDFYE